MEVQTFLEVEQLRFLNLIAIVERTDIHTPATLAHCVRGTSAQKCNNRRFLECFWTLFIVTVCCLIVNRHKQYRGAAIELGHSLLVPTQLKRLISAAWLDTVGDDLSFFKNLSILNWNFDFFYLKKFRKHEISSPTIMVVPTHNPANVPSATLGLIRMKTSSTRKFPAEIPTKNHFSRHSQHQGHPSGWW